MQLSQLHNAIQRCIELRIPFAVYALPGSDDYTFLSSEPDEAGENELPEDVTEIDGDFLRIDLFNSENVYPIGLHNQYTPQQIEELDPLTKPRELPDLQPCQKSTPRMLYEAQVHRIVSYLKARRRGKVVLSRIIAGTTARTDIAEIAKEYFDMHPATFRSLYFTQETGLWIGATPEQLLSVDAEGTYHTMSLAGTRSRTDEPWDEKNIDEQEYVTEHIIETVRNLTAETPSVSPDLTVAFGDIEHRCNKISWHTSCASLGDLLHTLSPTPAVAGTPRNEAIEIINSLETHPRNSYAGYLLVKTHDGYNAYVNLRCALLQPTTDGRINYNIYIGSGITRYSKPEVEWEETSAKGASLLEVLHNKTNL